MLNCQVLIEELHQIKQKIYLLKKKSKKLRSFDLGYLKGKSHFDEDGSQHYLVFQVILRYFELNSSWITEWKLKGLSNENLKVISTTNNTLTPSINYYGDKVRLKFIGSVLQHKTVTYSHQKVVNIYVVYEIDGFQNVGRYPTLANALFEAVELTKNADVEKYRYFGYGIRFDGRGFYYHPSGGNGRNAIIFGGGMSSSVHANNKRKDILIIGKGQTQGLGEHSLTAEKMYSINFTKINTKFCLSLHYNGTNSYFLLMVPKFTNLKQKIL